MPKTIEKTDAEWRAMLTPLQYAVTRKRGTERAHSGEWVNTRSPGIYSCICCGTTLLAATEKFDSGTGWPSWTAPIEPERLREAEDTAWMRRRTEVLCATCDAHLGHVFDDGPAPTGKRYSINSAALAFKAG